MVGCSNITGVYSSLCERDSYNDKSLHKQRRQKENAQKSRQVQAVQEEIDRDFDGRRQRAKDRRPLP